jgi:hypothetical protein
MPRPILVPLAVTLLVSSACARALREPPPISAIGERTAVPGSAPEPSQPSDVDRLLGEAAGAFGRRPDLPGVGTARTLYLRAARADESRVEGLLGAATVTAWIIEHEIDAGVRQALATEGVQVCQWCGRRAPTNVECTYRLALAIGQQARERRTTAVDGLKQMVPLLEQVIARAPTLDRAGGDRVLALVLLRAPGWPTGPGDPDAALAHARRADALVPNDPENLNVLGEALATANQVGDARSAYRRAESLARALAAAGNPDAGEWAETAAGALRRLVSR